MKKIELRTAYLWIFFLKVNFINKEKLFITSIINSIILQKTCPLQQPSRRLNNPARTDERTGESPISVNKRSHCTGFPSVWSDSTHLRACFALLYVVHLRNRGPYKGLLISRVYEQLVHFYMDAMNNFSSLMKFILRKKIHR